MTNSLHLQDVLTYGKSLAAKGAGLELSAVAMTCLAIHTGGDSKAARKALKGASFARKAAIMGENLMTLKLVDVPTIAINSAIEPDDKDYVAKLCAAIVKTIRVFMKEHSLTSNTGLGIKLKKLLNPADADADDDDDDNADDDKVEAAPVAPVNTVAAISELLSKATDDELTAILAMVQAEMMLRLPAESIAA